MFLFYDFQECFKVYIIYLSSYTHTYIHTGCIYKIILCLFHECNVFKNPLEDIGNCFKVIICLDNLYFFQVAFFCLFVFVSNILIRIFHQKSADIRLSLSIFKRVSLKSCCKVLLHA